MAIDFKLYQLLINRILWYDNLSYINGMINKTEGFQIIENQISLKEISLISDKIMKNLRKFKCINNNYF